MTPDEIEQDVERYRVALPRLARFERGLVPLVRALLENEGRDIHQIESRCKPPGDFREKIIRKGYTEPFREMTDQVGLRIIMFYDSDVTFAGGVLRQEFVVDEVNSHDARVPDEDDRFGYESYHLVVSMKPERLALAEWREFDGLQVEIQIRTVLQHAWAAVHHKLGYKKAEPLSPERRRKLSRVAAFLESADEVFDEIRLAEDQAQVAREEVVFVGGGVEGPT